MGRVVDFKHAAPGPQEPLGSRSRFFAVHNQAGDWAVGKGRQLDAAARKRKRLGQGRQLSAAALCQVHCAVAPPDCHGLRAALKITGDKAWQANASPNLENAVNKLHFGNNLTTLALGALGQAPGHPARGHLVALGEEAGQPYLPCFLAATIETSAPPKASPEKLWPAKAAGGVASRSEN